MFARFEPRELRRSFVELPRASSPDPRTGLGLRPRPVSAVLLGAAGAATVGFSLVSCTPPVKALDSATEVSEIRVTEVSAFAGLSGWRTGDGRLVVSDETPPVGATSFVGARVDAENDGRVAIRLVESGGEELVQISREGKVTPGFDPNDVTSLARAVLDRCDGRIDELEQEHPYVYFNAGPGFGRRMLREEGLAYFRAWEGPEPNSNRNAQFNSLVRLGQAKLLDALGVF
ncbi:MAG: hypothetical protein HY791_33040 [Deltaproteobacteria bacterium]|nr:hypothetical protein [Deltaproteobacteria bacterium]